VKLGENLDLTLIVPNYNSERTIVRCLDSIKPLIDAGAQVILINDGSQDNSLALVKAWKQSEKIELINFDINQGSAAARNAGLKAANRNWIMFLDADDELVAENVLSLLGKVQTSDEIIVASLEVIDSTDLKELNVNNPASYMGTLESHIEFLLSNRGFSRIIYNRNFIKVHDIQFFPSHADLNGFRYNMDDYFYLLTVLFFLREKPRFEAIPVYKYYVVPGDRKRYREQCQKFGVGFDMFIHRTIRNYSLKRNLDSQKRAVIRDAIDQYAQCILELRGVATLLAIPQFLIGCKKAKESTFFVFCQFFLITLMFIKVNLGVRTFLKSRLRLLKSPDELS
jgi:glycosyltransferase involved in cell wall biosynthesis